MSQYADFLVEIVTEELPPHSLVNLSDAFCANVINALTKQQFSFGQYKTFASPRRLGLLIENLAAVQPTQFIERRGPSVHTAFDERGHPTAALQGFAKSCAVSIEQLERIETAQGAWFVYRAQQAGQSIMNLAVPIITAALQQLPIPKKMRWGSTEFEFVRPVHNVLMLYGTQVIPGELFGIATSYRTVGHRFHCAEPWLTINKASDYEHILEDRGFVIPQAARRQQLIREQLENIAQAHGFIVDINENLLSEVTALVEWPRALLCHFKADFLTVPPEVLVLAMRHHQKSFAVYDQHKKLLPHFITVSNIDSKEVAAVIRGNERVMHARLSDAAFFYAEDLKVSVKSYEERLRNITYQQELGSLYDKSERLARLSRYVAGKISPISENMDAADHAGRYAKLDLATHMVEEFPELQGIIGKYYWSDRYLNLSSIMEMGEEFSKLTGIISKCSKSVAQRNIEIAVHLSVRVPQAIAEHYAPAFSGDKIPASDLGCFLSLADRVDTLVGIFGINQLPTGDKDPFGLRRCALGIIRIILEKKYSLAINELLEEAKQCYQHPLPNTQLIEQLMRFINERLKVFLGEQGITADVFAAVDALSLTDLVDIRARLQAVQQFKSSPAAAALAAANKRIRNFLKNQYHQLHGKSLDNHLLQHPAERALAQQLTVLQTQIEHCYQRKDYTAILTHLSSLRAPIDHFFNDVLVTVDDEKLRLNRLVLLNQLQQLFLKVADISLLQ